MRVLVKRVVHKLTDSFVLFNVYHITQAAYLAVAEVAGEGSEVELQLFHIPLVMLQGQELPEGLYRRYNICRMDGYSGCNVRMKDGWRK